MDKKTKILLVTAIGAMTPVIAQTGVYLSGFTKAGVAAKSLAASLQVPLTLKGSSFAILQSVGAKAALLSPPVLLTAGIAAVTIGGVVYLYD